MPPPSDDRRPLREADAVVLPFGRRAAKLSRHSAAAHAEATLIRFPRRDPRGLAANAQDHPSGHIIVPASAALVAFATLAIAWIGALNWVDGILRAAVTG